MSEKRASRMIGLAMKAGKVITGSELCINAIREGKAKLVLIAKDASGNTQKRLRDKCSYYQVPIMDYSDKEQLGKILGKEERSAAAVTEEGFAKVIIEYLKSEDKN